MADPELADRLEEALGRQGRPLSADRVCQLTDCLIVCLSQNRPFGEAVARGSALLVQRKRRDCLAEYLEAISRYGHQGATIGTLMADHLVPVFIGGDRRFRNDFFRTVTVLDAKGTYTLPPLLAAISHLLNEGDTLSADRLMALCRNTFDRQMSYNTCQHLSHTLSAAATAFHRKRRAFQIDALASVAGMDPLLTEPFLDGMAAGAATLSAAALKRFVAAGAALAGDGREKARSFLSLRSRHAVAMVRELQVAVPLTDVTPRLARYIKARLGLPLRMVSRKPAAAGEGCEEQPPAWVHSDATALHLPGELDLFDNREQNRELYDHLVRLEIGYHEFRTFDFDLGRLWTDYPQQAGEWLPPSFFHQEEAGGDMVRFFHLFPVPDLARDLFTIFEHARQALLTTRRYPGLARRLATVIQKELERIDRCQSATTPLQQLYGAIAVAHRPNRKKPAGETLPRTVSRAVELFTQFAAKGKTPAVEICGALVCATYRSFEKACCTASDATGLCRVRQPAVFPFDRRLRPARFLVPMAAMDHLAGEIRRRLAIREVHLCRSDIRHRLQQRGGNLSYDDLIDLVETADASSSGKEVDAAAAIAAIEVEAMLDHGRTVETAGPESGGEVHWYREWDHRLGDYLNHHTRVLDKNLGPVDNGFYARTLQHHGGLIKKIRRSFELLKPAGLSMLRQWVEGDEFDYRALVDFALDRKMKRVPSDRIYIKRIKQERDVAVQLLVDLSRSTANLVRGTRQTVLDVEKEALVLFCEALEVVGDEYALSGFSGTGRLGVDYVGVKDFDERLNDTVRGRINALLPMRSTRMGAAIRHAVTRIERHPARVRLLIIIGDGFPNDANYKQAYAVADTRKAIAEARTKNVYTHAITVNMAGDGRLDAVYGSLHHNVISDVRDLPDRLLRIYGRLTRN